VSIIQAGFLRVFAISRCISFKTIVTEEFRSGVPLALLQSKHTRAVELEEAEAGLDEELVSVLSSVGGARRHEDENNDSDLVRGGNVAVGRGFCAAECNGDDAIG
jgi:hypothetical protein